MEDKIFISYSHSDYEVVSFIANKIQQVCDGREIWYDGKLRGGEHYFSTIATQIMDCNFFVFMVSKDSVTSDWCLRELEFAASEKKNIVAIWLQDITIPPRVKLTIQNTNYIKYNKKSEDEFRNELYRCFVENIQPINYSGSGRNQDDDMLVNNEVYFLETEKLRKIEELLKKEKESKYSVCFLPDNSYLLGLAYELGLRVEKDLIRAKFYYKISDHKGNYEGKYLYAALRLKELDEKRKSLLETTDIRVVIENDSEDFNEEQYLLDKKELLDEMHVAAENHSVFALTYLGDDYYFGRNGLDKDIAKAYQYFEEASNLGGARAMYYIAHGYRVGEVLKKDIYLSYMYALMSSEHNFPRAFRILGFIYESDDLYPRDISKAIELYEEAIKRKDYLSLCYEGWLYQDEEDYSKARGLYKKAIELANDGKITSGLPFFRMGYIYEYALGVDVNIEKAVEYYLMAAEKGYKRALNCTVKTIMEIENIDIQEKFLKQAYIIGCEGAAYELGCKEELLNEEERLSPKAVEFFEKGAEIGEMACVLKLILNYSWIIGNGDGDCEKDRINSLKWFQFFFANVNEELLKELAPASYYYAYAIELDYPLNDNKVPDRELVRLYFKKALDKDTTFFKMILYFIVDGYLYPEKSDSGMEIDVVHAIEILELLENYIFSLHDRLFEDENINSVEEWDEAKQLFVRGYNKIAECYNKGITVPKNKTEAYGYKKKSQEIVQLMNGMVQ